MKIFSIFCTSRLDNDNYEVPSRRSAEPGIANGLQLELFVGSPDYAPCWTSTHGVVLFVHNRSSNPLLYIQGARVEAGKESSFAVQRLFVNKLPAPYSNCVADVTSETAYDSEFYRSTFAYMDAYEHIYCMFDCVSYKLNVSELDDCSRKNFYTVEQLRTCFLESSNFEPFFSECFPLCPLECSTQLLSTLPSYAAYPTRASVEAMVRKIKNFSQIYFGDDKADLSYDKMKNSVLALNVYYDSIMYTQVDDSPAQDIGSVLSNIGGLLGLFIGISVLSFLEVVEYIYEIVYILLKYNTIQTPTGLSNPTMPLTTF